MAILPDIAENQLPDGVYIGLPEEIYFAQDALGSSDLKTLHFEREGWWMQSRHNPDRKRTQSKAMNFGSATHCLLLEGMAAYEERFVVLPEKDDFEDLLETMDHIKKALAEEGIAAPTGSSKWKLFEWADFAAIELPDRHIWDIIRRSSEEAAKDAEGNMRPSVFTSEDRLLRLMYDAACSEDHIRQLMGIGAEFPPLRELSFFWTDDMGVRRRARFDKPVPLFTMDLKTIDNWRGRDLVHSLCDHILREGLDIQVGDQHDARLRMHRLIQKEGEDCIYGGSDEERTWLRAIAERDLTFDWVWLFYQKPTLAGKAPIIFPIRDPWGGRFHISGFRKARRAIQAYCQYRDRFGLDSPWYRVEPLHNSDEIEKDVPSITLSHFGWDQDPIEGEDDHINRRV